MTTAQDPLGDTTVLHSTMIPMSPQAQELFRVVERDGMVEALRLLNLRVLHRFTAVYRLQDGLLRNLYLFDKSGAMRSDFLAEVPLEDSFCQFVFKDHSFHTDDSRLDQRLNGHPYQGVVVSYHAVPLLAQDQSIWGTLCHIDFEPRSLDPIEFDFLNDIAPGLCKLLVHQALVNA